jgi:hypothetical protein
MKVAGVIESTSCWEYDYRTGAFTYPVNHDHINTIEELLTCLLDLEYAIHCTSFGYIAVILA